MNSFLMFTTVSLLVFVCVVLVLLILIQKGRGGGLANAFGGGGGNTAFGSKTGDVLTWATSIVFGVFLLLAVAANLIFNRVDANARAANAIPPAIVVGDETTPTGLPGPAPLEPPSTAPTTAPSTQSN